MRRLINRYILKEIAVPFCMILLVLTFVLLMGKILQLMDLMINKGIRFRDIAQLMLFLMPSFLMFTIPISLLIAILIGMGRLSGDNEITVLKMSGISLYQLAFPVAFAALAAFIMTAATTLFLVPYGNWAAKNLLYDMAKQKASIGIREKVFIDDFRGLLLYAEKIPVQGNFLEGVLISDNRIMREPSTIIARKAYLVSDPDTMAITLRLEDGSIHTADAGLKNYRKMDFRFYDVRLDLPSSLSEEKQAGAKSSTEMTVAELSAKLRSRGIEQTALRELAIEFNKKLTIPLSCLVFALIALPLGIRAHRSVRARGFTIGFAIVLIFYLMRLSGEALVETGRLSPVIGTWTPNAVFAIAGILLFIFSAREQHPRAFLRSCAPGDGPHPFPPAQVPPPANIPFPGAGDNHSDAERAPDNGVNSRLSITAAKDAGKGKRTGRPS
jgi:lipopolysaccharide export system permease protein